MKRMVLFLAMSAIVVSFCQSSGKAQIGGGEQTPPPAEWSFQTPTAGSTFTSTAGIGCTGEAREKNTVFVLRAVPQSQQSLILQSTSGTSTSSYEWQGTLSAPAGGWPSGSTIILQVVVSGHVKCSRPVTILP